MYIRMYVCVCVCICVCLVCAGDSVVFADSILELLPYCFDLAARIHSVRTPTYSDNFIFINGIICTVHTHTHTHTHTFA